MMNRHKLWLTSGVTVVAICLAVQLTGQAIAEEKPDRPRPEPGFAPPPLSPGPPGLPQGPGRFDAFMGRHLGSDMDKKDVEELLHVVRAWRMMKEVGLTEEQTLKFLNLERKMKEESAKLGKEREQVQRDLLKLVEDPKSDDAAITKQLQALEQLEQKQLEVLRESDQKMRGDLTVRQRAKLKLFRVRFERDMRRLIEHVRERQELTRQLQERPWERRGGYGAGGQGGYGRPPLQQPHSQEPGRGGPPEPGPNAPAPARPVVE